MKRTIVLLSIIVMLGFAGSALWWQWHTRQATAPPAPVASPPHNAAPQPSQPKPPVTNTPSNSRETRIAETAQQKHPQRVAIFAEQGLELKLGETRDEIAAALGKPKRASSIAVRNEYDPQFQDTYYTWDYGGLSVVICHVGEDNHEFVDEYTVTSPRYPVKWGLNVGVSTNKVIQVLGKPRRHNKNCLEYDTGYAGNDVSFTYAHGKITSICWSNKL